MESDTENTKTATSSSDESPEFTCNPCAADGVALPAAGYCSDCREYLCTDCFRVHCRPSVTRHHVLMDVTSMPRDVAGNVINDMCTEQCSKHEHKIVEYYCKTHEELGCSVCMTTLHRSCADVDYVPDIAGDIKHETEINHLIKALEELIDEARVHKSKVESHARTIDINGKIAVSKIQNMRKDVNAFFDKLEEKILTEVTEMQVDDVNKVEKLQETLEDISGKASILLRDVDRQLKQKQMCRLFIVIKTYSKTAKDLRDNLESVMRKNIVRRYEFVPEKKIIDLENMIMDFGELIIKESSVKVPESAGSLNVASNEDQGMPNISGIKLLNSFRIVAVDNPNKIVKIVNINTNKLESKISCDGNPWDVTKIDEKTIAVTFPNMSNITFYSIEDTHSLSQSRIIKVDGNCYGIDHHQGSLYVSFNNPGSVKVLDLDGKILEKFSQSFGVPWYVAVSADGRSIYVSDSGQNAVTLMDSQGQVKNTFKDASLLGIRGIATDRSGSVYVCGWSSNNVMQMTSYFSKEQTLQDGKLRIGRPYCVAYCDVSDRLFIGMSNDHLRIIQFH
ncbi:uncharacterized protein LOC127831632 [Dreissena polymorpha]|uniref:B box-type domain-containing protein n=1 Tax=Dreissena polymorpha TaxID=45954 RepID=A0A9D4GVT8_DREPO|nr:uncharacterized protein LOC127831632 [Dreissena polymorpha]KAH3822344.1 hypothetical protein DPMN_124121 [Dreissena polymorpha]